MTARLRQAGILAVALAAVGSVGWADYATGYHLGVSLLYTLPIGLTAVRMGFWAGVATAAVSTAVWFAVNTVGREDAIPGSIHLWNALIRMGFFLAFLLPLEGWKREQQYARKDFLTEVANRRAFNEWAQREIRWIRRYPGPFSVVYLDCDRLKEINDHMGHSRGNATLRSLAGCLQETTRETDLVARLGGDEFALLLPQTDEKALDMVLRRIRESISRITPDGQSALSVSIGAVTYHSPPESVDAMLQKADRLMYLAKQEKGQSVVRREVVAPAARTPPPPERGGR